MPVRKTHEEYVQQLKDKGIGARPVEKYINQMIKILHRCECGNEWSVRPNDVLQGKKCGCGLKTPLDQLEKKYYKDLKRRKINVRPLEPYLGCKVKIAHECECGTIFSVEPSVVLRGVKCGCGKVRRNAFSNEKYFRKLKEKNIGVLPLEDYITTDTKILHRCVCGTEWNTTPHEVLSGRRCGCNRSRVEVEINNYLKNRQFDFKKEYAVREIESNTKKPLRYDFALFSKNKVIALIEYHGEQHFKYSKFFFKTKENFIKRQQRDQLKRQYAIDKGIPLIEITYKNKNVIPSLEEELNILGIGQNVEQLVLF